MLLILSFEGNKIRTTLPLTLFIRITLQYSSKSLSLEMGQFQFVIQFVCLGGSQALYSCFAPSEGESTQFSLEQILTGRKTIFFTGKLHVFLSHFCFVLVYLLPHVNNEETSFSDSGNQNEAPKTLQI